MKRFRYLLSTLALLTSAQAGFAVSPSTASLQALLATGEEEQTTALSDPACPAESFSLRQVSGCLSRACPVIGQGSWLNYLYQHGMSACQRLCGGSGRGAMVCQPDSACCEAASGNCVKAFSGPCNKTSRTTGIASCCVKESDAVQAQKCCCAKECACCESCKKTRTESSACEQACPQQAGPRFGVIWDSLLPPVQGPGYHLRQWALRNGLDPVQWALRNGIDPNLVDEDPLPFAGQHFGPWVLPVPGPGGWTVSPPQRVPQCPFIRESLPLHGAVQPRVIAVPAPGVPVPQIPYHMVRQTVPTRNVAQAQRAHLATPELDAHCERMIHKGEMILLEGDVRLVSRKHGQNIRIEAHRVLLNMKDGTFTVESDTSPARATQFGISRTSAEGTPFYNPYCVPLNSAVEKATHHGIQLFPVPIPIQESLLPTYNGTYNGGAPVGRLAPDSLAPR